MTEAGEDHQSSSGLWCESNCQQSNENPKDFERTLASPDMGKEHLKPVSQLPYIDLAPTGKIGGAICEGGQHRVYAMLRRAREQFKSDKVAMKACKMNYLETSDEPIEVRHHETELFMCR